MFIKSNCSDEKIIKIYYDGGHFDFEHLYKKYYPRILHFCYTMTFNFHDSQNIVQEAMYNTYNYIYEGNFDLRISKFRTFLYKVAKNKCIDHNKSAKVYHLFDGKESIPSQEISTVEEKVFLNSSLRFVQSQIDQLNDNQKNALILRVNDFTYSEISQILEIPPCIVKTAIHRARLKIRNAYFREKNNVSDLNRSMDYEM